ncbi:MAG: hypothetical protein HYT08_04130 [Candidatus Levybacteria bacterium]|nr:hypothetical protein [Candidatus Levybacteria bacterium]
MLHPHKEMKHGGNLFHRILTGIVMVVATLSPLITAPQLINIYISRNVSGVSQVTWLAYVFTASMWFSYGVIHRERVLIINGALGVILGSLISLGIVLYR